MRSRAIADLTASQADRTGAACSTTKCLRSAALLIGEDQA
jgi:hypothetical protein